MAILVVEDHKDTADLLDHILRGLGHKVKTADSVAAARQLAADHSFDLVISDLGLPDGSGLDLMQHLRQAHGLKGIALTGYGMEEDVVRTREAGFAEHLASRLISNGWRRPSRGLPTRHNRSDGPPQEPSQLTT